MTAQGQGWGWVTGNRPGLFVWLTFCFEEQSALIPDGRVPGPRSQEGTGEREAAKPLLQECKVAPGVPLCVRESAWVRDHTALTSVIGSVWGRERCSRWAPGLWPQTHLTWIPPRQLRSCETLGKLLMALWPCPLGDTVANNVLTLKGFVQIK